MDDNASNVSNGSEFIDGNGFWSDSWDRVLSTPPLSETENKISNSDGYDFVNNGGAPFDSDDDFISRGNSEPLSPLVPVDGTDPARRIPRVPVEFHDGNPEPAPDDEYTRKNKVLAQGRKILMILLAFFNACKLLAFFNACKLDEKEIRNPYSHTKNAIDLGLLLFDEETKVVRVNLYPPKRTFIVLKSKLRDFLRNDNIERLVETLGWFQKDEEDRDTIVFKHKTPPNEEYIGEGTATDRILGWDAGCPFESEFDSYYEEKTTFSEDDIYCLISVMDQLQDLLLEVDDESIKYTPAAAEKVEDKMKLALEFIVRPTAGLRFVLDEHEEETTFDQMGKRMDPIYDPISFADKDIQVEGVGKRRLEKRLAAMRKQFQRVSEDLDRPSTTDRVRAYRGRFQRRRRVKEDPSLYLEPGNVIQLPPMTDHAKWTRIQTLLEGSYVSLPLKFIKQDYRTVNESDVKYSTRMDYWLTNGAEMPQLLPPARGRGGGGGGGRGGGGGGGGGDSPVYFGDNPAALG